MRACAQAETANAHSLTGRLRAVAEDSHLSWGREGKTVPENKHGDDDAKWQAYRPCRDKSPRECQQSG
jgi:hypothetical protein